MGHEDEVGAADGTEFDEYLQVIPLDDAPDVLVQMAFAYWDLEEIDEYDNVRWATPSTQLETNGLGQIHHIAAAGARAFVPGASCQTCGKNLAVRTRSDFVSVFSGGQATCVACDDKYVAAASKVRSALGGEKYLRESASRARKEAEKKWKDARLEAVEERHPFKQTPDVPPPRAPLDASVAMLAILRFSPFREKAPWWIPPIDTWDTPIAAGPKKDFEAVERAYKSGLMNIYPWIPEAFIYRPETFQQALSEAGGDVAGINPPELTGTFFPLDASYYVPYGPSAGTALKVLDDSLAHRVSLSNLTESDRLALLALVKTTIAEEALRYFEFRIRHFALAPVPEQHMPRLRDAALKAAEYMPLGRMYAQAWRATKDGAAAAQRHSMPNSPNMSTFAVNQFERFVAERANVGNGDPFTENDSVPLAAMTNILFRLILDANPMTLAVCDVSEILESIQLPDDGSWAWSEASDNLMKAISVNLWSGAALRNHLSKLRDSWKPVQALSAQVRVAERLLDHFDLYAQRRDQQTASLETVGLAALLAKAGENEARAAQTILLCLSDTLASGASDGEGDVIKQVEGEPGNVGAVSPEGSSGQDRGRSDRPGPPRRNQPKKKRKRR